MVLKKFFLQELGFVMSLVAFLLGSLGNLGILLNFAKNPNKTWLNLVTTYTIQPLQFGPKLMQGF